VLGFGRLAQRDVAHLDDETHTLIDAYVQGINTFLDTHHSRLPLECALLRHEPEPWQVADVLLWGKVIAYSLSLNWIYEWHHARVAAALGEEQARALLPHIPESHIASMSENLFAQHGIGEEVAHSSAANAARNANGGRKNGSRPGLPGQHGNPGQGSNAWAVRGQRSASGKPLLASDPHLRLSLPSIWYEAHLEGGDYRVTGATFPGMPGVAIGHNEHIAWGVTNAMTDVQDLYIERFDPDDPLRYEWRGNWEQAELVREAIDVKGQSEPFIEEVRITRHGPVINPLLGEPEPPADVASEAEGEPAPTVETPPAETLALRWTGFDSSRSVQAALAVNRARNWQEFRTALADWDSPPQNFIYADVEGHYGYALAGTLPIRARGDGQFPVPGWDGRHEWKGTIPADALPAAYDPPDGLVFNSNNRITDASHPYHDVLHGSWMNDYRAMRIRSLLEATAHHDVQSFARMQADLLSLPGLHLARLVADLPLSEPLEVQARDLLVAWDGTLSADSTAGMIYVVLRRHLEHLAYAHLDEVPAAEVGMGLFQTNPAAEMLAQRSLPGILARIAAAQQPDEHREPHERHAWTEMMQEALRLTVAELRQRYGADPKGWKYGRAHTLTLRHVLGRSGFLAPLFNRGSWQMGGDLDTVWMGYVTSNPSEPSYIAPGYRQICDTGNWDASVSVLAGGQSGHPASRHYCDMMVLWLRGDYHPMLWSREQVEKHAAATLLLEPEPDTPDHEETVESGDDG
jgi:penicillin amidase